MADGSSTSAAQILQYERMASSERPPSELTRRSPGNRDNMDSPARGLDRAEWERLTQQSVDPDRCPICDEPWAVVVGCHKVCRCGNMEGCGD